MNDDELKAILSAQHAAALGESNSSRLSDRRMTALKRYRGELYGDEQAGRSKVVSWDVFDVVESTLPALLKIFASTDKIVECEPVSQEDEEAARQAGDYINYVFQKDNHGFNVLQTLFKDGLLQINGFVKTFWEESESWVEKTHTGITEEQIPLLLQGEYVLTSQEQRIEMMDDGTQIPVYDIKAKCKKVEKRARVMCVAPEDVGIIPGTLDLDDCDYCYTRDTTKTVSDLIEMGYDRELARQCVSVGSDNQEAEERAQFEDDFPGVDWNSVDESMRPVVLVEHYIRVDYDGDGIAEYRKITTGGDDGFVILDNEELAENPLVTFTPIPLPHQTFGLALAETVIPVADVKTTLQRQMLDNLYRVNSSRMYVDQTKVNENTISDLLNDVPGGIIRGDGDRGVYPMPVQPIGQEIFTAIEYQDTLAEQRSGVTRYNQGLDADSLNKTATGIQIIQNAAQERQMLVARIAGESVKRIFAKLLRLTIRHQDVPRVVRLRNKWVTVDPREWNMEMDINISVGLGTGNKEQMLAHLMGIYKMQMETLPLGVVTPEQIAHTIEKTVENMGFKDVESFVMDGEQLQQAAEAQASQPPQPSPEEMKMKMDAEMGSKKLEQDAMLSQAQMASKEKIDLHRIDTDARLKREKALLEMGLDPHTVMAQADLTLFEESRQKMAEMGDITQQNLMMMQQMLQAMQQGMETLSQQITQVAMIAAAPRQKRVNVHRTNGKITGAEVVEEGVTLQ